jgi:tellurite resistance protein TerC
LRIGIFAASKKAWIMNHDQVMYLVFGVVLVLALVFDLGLLSKKGSQITMRKALYQTLFWVCLSVGFFGYLWMSEGRIPAFLYFRSLK